MQVRGRRWLVEQQTALEDGPAVVHLACVDDDAQGQVLCVAWQAEVDASVLTHSEFAAIASTGTDDPATFAAYFRTVRWNTATAADRDLFQSPFRAGIRLDACQLLPLRKALRLPRVNLLIADDVGLGKTVEAGLILRELLLRRRIDFVLVAPPAGMVQQWVDELESKFGLAFTIVDREHLLALRRDQGFGANPWSAGSRFVLSQSLMTNETYTSGLRDWLGNFKPHTLLILDEAHHAAPASGARYAVDSQFTRVVRDLAGRFEHRLFLSATPHHGHSNSFSSLLEILDPQRFERGIEIAPAQLRPVMVRRLKSDLRSIGKSFPDRVVEPILLDGLPDTAPELVLSRMLLAYGTSQTDRISRLPPRQAAQARLLFVGLQQRLLSSIPAFAHTLRVHHNRLQVSGGPVDGASLTEDFTAGAPEAEEGDDITEEMLEAAELAAAAAAAASALALRFTPDAERRAELDQVEAMLTLADQHLHQPDARVRELLSWIREHMAPSGQWSHRRLVLFTEWEATRRWLERQLLDGLADLDPQPRLATFMGVTSAAHRDVLKLAFNSDPANEPLRILLCTDAAREGINLQSRCHDLIHMDLPWNPAKLEQRNGRIDRKLQPSPTVWCRYFVYAQRPEDIVLQALVQKTERIRLQLGSTGQVIAARLTDRMAQHGILRPQAMAAEMAAEADDPRAAAAIREMDDATTARLERQREELDDLLS